MKALRTPSKWRLAVVSVLGVASVATATSWTIVVGMAFLLGATEQTACRKQLVRWSRPWTIAVTYEAIWCLAGLMAALVRTWPHGLAWSVMILGATLVIDLTHRTVFARMRHSSRWNRERVARPLAWLMGVFMIWIIFVILDTIGIVPTWSLVFALTGVVPLAALRAPEVTIHIRKVLTVKSFGAPWGSRRGLTDLLDRYAAAFLVGSGFLLVLHLGGVAL